jgi:transcription initiation factor TFIID subunit 5
MSEEPLDRIVLRYLQKRGYKDAERALKSEAKIQSLSQMALVPHLGADATIADHILFYNESDSDPNALVQGYRLLREWVHNSLDLYKVRPPRSPVAPPPPGSANPARVLAASNQQP